MFVWESRLTMAQAGNPKGKHIFFLIAYEIQWERGRIITFSLACLVYSLNKFQTFFLFELCAETISQRFFFFFRFFFCKYCKQQVYICIYIQTSTMIGFLLYFINKLDLFLMHMCRFTLCIQYKQFLFAFCIDINSFCS